MLCKTSNHPLSIIVIDDEVELASLFREYFKALGYDAISFTDPLLALEHYRHNVDRFTHVLTDLRMPEMSGIEFACEVRKSNDKVRIFLITAFELDDITSDKDYAKARIETILQKPLPLNTLKQCLDNCRDISTTQLAG
ncbi:MAG: response regulator [Candidatus Nitrosocosmicus sp.]|nr:response regulator [Candidatus Nitrosocosmicus sp.]